MNDYFDELETGLRDAVRRRAHLPWPARLLQLSLRHRGLAVVVASLAVATPAVAAVGAASGWFSKGSSDRYYPASPTHGLGKVFASGSRLLPIRVADPGGGPPWGMRLVKTSRGETCIQVGRVVDGQIGALGIDGAWNDDHKFHEIKPNDQLADICGATDSAGNGFVNQGAHGAPASVDVPLYNSGGGPGRCRSPFTSVVPQFAKRHGAKLSPALKKWLKRIELERGKGGTCPANAMRMVFAGLLGPDAKSITYKTPSGQTKAEQTAGGVGAYLVVFKETAANCNDFTTTLISSDAGGCQSDGNGDGPELRAPTAVTSVTYTNGKTCSDQRSASFAAAFRAFEKRTRTQKETAAQARRQMAQFMASQHMAGKSWVDAVVPECQPVGFVRSTTPKLTSKDVASPIRVKLQTGIRFCVERSQIGTFNGAVVCDRRVPRGDRFLYGAGPGQPATLVTVTFVARQPVRTDNSTYSITVEAPGNNGGSGDGTNFNVRAGQKITQSWFLGQKLRGTYHGVVTFIQDVGQNGLHGGGSYFRGRHQGQLVVGRFSFTMH